MHVLQLYKDYYPVMGGIENHLRLLAEGLASRGHRVTVLVTGQDLHTTTDERAGVRIIYAGRLARFASTPLSPAMMLQAAGLADIDLIHLHHPFPPGDLAALAVPGHPPLIVHYHSDIVRQRRLLQLYTPLLHHVLRRARRIVATSPRYIETSPFLRPLAERCSVIPYGIDLARFLVADPLKVAAIKQRFGGPLILFVGQLRYYKGVEQLVQAMANLPDAQALLIGGESSVRQHTLVTVARAAGVADRIHLLGEIDEELPAYYHAADIFTLPSIERSEAFGIVQIEAQAAGRPIVCTELGTGTSYVTRHGETGFVVPPADPAALARAIKVLLANPALARRLGENGRRRAIAEFDREQMLNRIETMYGEVIE